MDTTASLTSLRCCAAMALAFGLMQPAFADDQIVRVGGTGIALAAMHEIGVSLTAAEPAIRVEVLPSMGTPGGIKALAEGAIDVAVVARPLKPDEKAKGVAEAACLTTALVFASSHKAASGITKAQLPGLYADASPKWPDGTALKVILRARAGSENPYLVAAIPEMGPALEAAYKRPGMPAGSTDQDNAKLATQIPGSFAVMTLLQLKAERLDLQPLRLDGVAASAVTIANGTYPFPIRICALLPREPTPAAARFVAHLRSAAGKAIVESFGATPTE